MADAFDPDPFEGLLPESLERELAELQALPASRRRDRLERLCAAHPRHRDQILALARLTLLLDSDGDRLPEHVGPYRVVRCLGEGGMGRVFLAQQTEPMVREVAVKVVKQGMDCHAVLRRFERERHAIAVMNHEAIARLYDAGTTAAGQPYFAMEFLDGLPLNAYCDQRRIDIRGRIEVLRDVCLGVQHAHQKGVLHRDLKPGNVLVADVDGRPAPKIIDFGLARAVHDSDAEGSLQTLHGQVLGTPEYMSPEQAAGEFVDTRTDIYALGVLLYELLCGQLPTTTTDPLRLTSSERIRRVRECQPPTPSARVSTLGPADADLPGRRRLTTRTLRRMLRGELDWIVMRAIDREPECRYRSVSGLADDLDRYLRGEPVVARPTSLGYRLRKFVRRHRLQVVSAAVVAVALVAGATAAALGLVEAEKGWHAARTNLDRFRQLAGVVKLESVESQARQLFPPWPAMIERMRRWRDRDAADALALVPELDAALRELRADAERLPAGDGHERLIAERARCEAERAALRTALARPPGSMPPPPVDAELERRIDRSNASTLALMAHELVQPDRHVFGRELEGLAMANAAVTKNGVWTPELVLLFVDAAIATGFDPLAEQVLARLDGEPTQARPELRPRIAAIRKRIDQGDRLRERRLAELDARLEALDRTLADRAGWRLADPSNQFLHDTLTRTRRELDRFRRRTYRDVEQRLVWAQHIDRVARDPHRQAWQAARAAIAASPRYADHAIDLQPQTGLVPIGANPVTGLWEFYHLRSAWEGAEVDPATLAVPAHRPDGTVELLPGTGIVFVLVPGGTFRMGAQRQQPERDNYDPFARTEGPAGNESPVHEVTLAPFFLARHELTSGQWRRLSGGETPSWNKPGAIVPGNLVAVDETFPVDSVTWSRCDGLARAFGLTLPTEAQWEYACRAGTTTAWWFGNRPEDAIGKLNVHDQRATQFHPGWHSVVVAPWDDGFSGVAPAGHYAANAWGLHDMLGNVSEWVRDVLCYYPRPPRPGDGERTDSTARRELRVRRGGTYHNGLEGARAAQREPRDGDDFASYVGVRFARAIDPAPR